MGQTFKDAITLVQWYLEICFSVNQQKYAYFQNPYQKHLKSERTRMLPVVHTVFQEKLERF